MSHYLKFAQKSYIHDSFTLNDCGSESEYYICYLPSILLAMSQQLDLKHGTSGHRFRNSQSQSLSVEGPENQKEKNLVNCTVDKEIWCCVLKNNKIPLHWDHDHRLWIFYGNNSINSFRDYIQSYISYNI